MIDIIRKTLTGAVVAAILGTSLATAAAPAAAQGWQSAAWRGGHWGPGGWRGGWGWHRGWGWGAPVAAGVATGLALGALAGAAASYPYYGYYGGCSWQNRPVYDSWGNFAGYAPVQVCY